MLGSIESNKKFNNWVAQLIFFSYHYISNFRLTNSETIDLISQKFFISYQCKLGSARSERLSILTFLELSFDLEENFYKCVVTENRSLNHFGNCWALCRCTVIRGQVAQLIITYAHRKFKNLGIKIRSICDRDCDRDRIEFRSQSNHATGGRNSVGFQTEFGRDRTVSISPKIQRLSYSFIRPRNK